MSQKIVDVEGIGRVVLAKRRGSRSLRLTIRPDGTVRVGLPRWAPYSAGIDFARRRRDWINKHAAGAQPLLLADGHRIGKSYRLTFDTRQGTKTTRTRVAANLISISSPHHHTSWQVQLAAQKACERALKYEAEKLLAQRIEQLSADNQLAYAGIRVKKLTSRWGSCSDKKLITLNYFLVQLPWHLIDYVIVHELVHTRHLNHSREFWTTFEQILPNAKQLRREIKNYKPVLTPA